MSRAAFEGEFDASLVVPLLAVLGAGQQGAPVAAPTIEGLASLVSEADVCLRALPLPDHMSTVHAVDADDELGELETQRGPRTDAGTATEVPSVDDLKQMWNEVHASLRAVDGGEVGAW